MRGAEDARVTLLVYGDYECPYTRRANRSVQEVERAAPGLFRFVFRHYPLREIHPHAQECSEAVEAASAQGRFWDLHDLLFHRQKALGHDDLLAYAGDLGLDTGRFAGELDSHAHAERVEEDVRSGDASGVIGTPTLFIGEQRYEDSFEPTALQRALEAAAGR